MKRQSIYLGFSLLLCFAVALAIKSHQPTPVEFENIRAAEKVIKSAGFFCVLLDHYNAMVISDTTITEDEAVQIQIKHAINQRPGFAFVSVSRDPYEPESPSLRTWGKITATGDPAMLDKIESAIK